jgi:hypothetical protein
VRQARTAAVRRLLARKPGGRGGVSAVIALVGVLALLWVPVAGAANDPPSPIGNPNYPRVHGRDPCTVKNKIPPWCQQAPEAPAGLLYPAAAGAALTLFFVLERRRRSRAGRPA